MKCPNCNGLPPCRVMHNLCHYCYKEVRKNEFDQCRADDAFALCEPYDIWRDDVCPRCKKRMKRVEVKMDNGEIFEFCKECAEYIKERYLLM